MPQKLLILFALVSFLILPKTIAAQEKSIEGTVQNAENETPLPGVNVIEKGTDNGTVTDFDGNFSLTVSPGAILEFSIIGFAAKEVTVTDQRSITINLAESTEALDEVVVTALGIKREEKTLTSSQQTIKADEISKTREPNFINSLSGKTAGLNITKSAAGAGGSSKIVLRGNKSLEGVSKPLFVIDGIPMLNNSVGGEGNSPFDSRDNGDGLSQINPDDIESVTVLKGSNSAALYGSQGSNGVILIETKSGEPGALHGNISSSIQLNNVMKTPQMQYRYGQKNQSGPESWSTTPGDYDNGFVDDFFNTGFDLTNSISLSGGSENSLSYLSYANTTSEGVVPENKYSRNNLTFKQTNKYFDDKLKVTARVMLSDEKVGNRPSTGYYFNPLTGLYLFPRNKDFNKYKDYETYSKDRNLMLQRWFVDSDKQQNPYWILNNNRSENSKKRLIGNVAISYELNDKIDFQVRGNYDYSRSQFDQKIQAGTTGALAPKNGRYRMGDFTSSMLYTDGLFTYSDNFGDFDIDATLGGSYQRTVIGKGISADSGTKGLKYANIFSLQNLNDNALISQSVSGRLKKFGLFGNVTIGYDDIIFLDFSGRNDWSSSLAYTQNSSYFYPSFGLSGLISEMINLPEVISFAKVRGSYSIVSNEVPAFFSHPLNSIGENGIDINTEKPFDELKPEDQYSLELGANLRFFGNRLGIDFTYYKIDNKNQFIPLDAPSGSGFTKYYVNAGHIRNSGFEIALTGTPVKNDVFQWDSNINFSSNSNEILELHPELQGRYQLSKSEGYASYITEGGHFGDIYTYKFERDDQNRIIVNDKGEPQRSSEEEYIGDSAPDFLFGWNNSFSYKNWNLSFLIDSKVGGKVVSGTDALLDSYGVSARTADARDQGEVLINGVDQSGNTINSVDPETYYKAVGGRDGILENYVYNATNIRLSELSVSYNFDFDDTAFFEGASISLIANNLFFIYKDAPFDPEVAFNPGNHFQGFNSFMVPSARSYGINLNLKF